MNDMNKTEAQIVEERLEHEIDQLMKRVEEIEHENLKPLSIKYEKIRDNVKDPERAHESDAGIDVFWCPDGPRGKSIVLSPGDSALLETGLKFEIPKGYMMDVCNRSSWAAKKKIIVGSHVIDSGYEGEVLINLHNIDNEEKRIFFGDKIAQIIMKPIVDASVVEVEKVYKGVKNERGEGGFGSTGHS